MSELNAEPIRVIIDNSAGWVITTNTGAASATTIITNSGGLFANQSGTWTVGISNSAGWIFSQSNTGGAFTLSNSSALAAIITNSQNWVIYVQQSGSWTQANTVSAVSIINSAGWVVGISNTSPLVQIQNSAGWVVAVSNTSPLVSVQNSAGWVINASSTILNSAGWIVSVSNTGGNFNITNSAGWTVFAVDSAAVGAVVTVVASTVGAATLAASNLKRVALSIYNASANPLFMKFGASASTASYTLMMVASGYYEMARPIYNGLVTGIWQTANGNAYISETT